jgi:hypothetical protein
MGQARWFWLPMLQPAPQNQIGRLIERDSLAD